MIKKFIEISRPLDFAVAILVSAVIGVLFAFILRDGTEYKHPDGGVRTTEASRRESNESPAVRLSRRYSQEAINGGTLTHSPRRGMPLFSEDGIFNDLVFDEIGVDIGSRADVKQLIADVRGRVLSKMAERMEIDPRGGQSNDKWRSLKIPGVTDYSTKELALLSENLGLLCGSEMGSVIIDKFDPTSQFGYLGRMDIYLMLPNNAIDGPVRLEYFDPLTGSKVREANLPDRNALRILLGQAIEKRAFEDFVGEPK